MGLRIKCEVGVVIGISKLASKRGFESRRVNETFKSVMYKELIQKSASARFLFAAL